MASGCTRYVALDVHLRRFGGSRAKQTMKRDVPTATWQVNGHEVVVTNLAKPLWSEQGLTKANLLVYYRELALTLLPYLHDRPFIMRRWPDGSMAITSIAGGCQPTRPRGSTALGTNSTRSRAPLRCPWWTTWRR